MRRIRIFYSLILSVYIAFSSVAFAQKKEQPLRIAVAGVSHGHLWDVVSRIDRGDFVVVGVSEADDQIRVNNGLYKKLDISLFYASLEEMLDKTQPEVAVAYGSIYDHLAVVEACAPRGIHVMVEKPLVVSLDHAQRMAELADKHQIKIITNYETTWYPTNHEAKWMIDSGLIGEITRINVYDGHQGPFEIGCGKEFTDWLTDPVLNGGGAVIDFGCYGANLATWLMNGQRPVSVYAVLKQQKPHLYPKVDDDATIVVEYPNATVQIMASWNWPINRKDMHIYGSKGYIYQDTKEKMRLYTNKKETNPVPVALEAPYNDVFYYLKAVVREEIEMKPYDLSALDNNLIVVEILQAAIQSHKTGEVIRFK
ncbi:Gfo/Idh/MocA family oxidoreductase [Parabacteroides sp. PF5-6]|uniref:Gfo/Idh/MocA family protein n=1 Tax=Parabacteroides sp. PF5-6 TaxID=1742403 RepID=UPI0024065BBE|nr:Gfo/Idh/MocA family oxidoreductase [Parabacteroides sp. PF5-6]MDF9829780.1 putative dehydrogenase [Parabacteroides sp. PF5-6]